MWHPNGKDIYFSYADFGQRSIKKINLESGVISDVLADNFTDYRDPFITENGRYLLYAANHKGQFNIYRKDLETHKTKN